MPEQIKCPFCKQRLMDLWTQGAKIDVKCSKCKKMVRVNQTIRVYAS